MFRCYVAAVDLKRNIFSVLSCYAPSRVPSPPWLQEATCLWCSGYVCHPEEEEIGAFFGYIPCS